MKPILFETIKNKAKEQIAPRLRTQNHTGFFPNESTFFALLTAAMLPVPAKPSDVLNEWWTKAQEIISQWDVRRVNTLVELFPECVPSSFRGKRLSADYDERGHWVVFPANLL